MMKSGKWVRIIMLSTLLPAACAGFFKIAFPLQGTDDSAAQTIAQVNPGYFRWIEPFFQPDSPVFETSLFVFQAGLGGLALGLGFYLLSEKKRRDA